MALSEIYRVGIGDVLDVQLVDTPTTKSTLFTVLDGGVLEYPLAGDPLPVAGLTADEIATRLRASIKVLEDPRVIVGIRDYASHTVQLIGLVSNPGAAFLRREAIPFYLVLAGAKPRAEAVRATISRSGQKEIQIDLNDQQSIATIVRPGDVIKLLGRSAQPAEYFYVTGAINSPGQRVFHSGLTLAQAIIASGGLTRAAISRVKLSRQGPDGRLTTREYHLRQIEAGKIADPVLLPGDRVAAL
jgi:protein involved in polysaccharide export with SLBB domain